MASRPHNKSTPAKAAPRRASAAPKKPAGARDPEGFVPKGNARYDRHDHFYRQAKKDGFVARSIYKLDEIDAKFKIIRRGNTVLDLGCAPGSWMQYAADTVGDRGAVVGIDLLKAKVAMPGHGRVIQGDAFTTPIEQLLVAPGRYFDVVLSDMAPNTSGIRSVDQARSMALCERALDVAEVALAVGGNFCCKIFEGEDQKAYLAKCKQIFADVDVYRPKSTRVGSMETYVIGRKKKPTPPATT